MPKVVEEKGRETPLGLLGQPILSLQLSASGVKRQLSSGFLFEPAMPHIARPEGRPEVHKGVFSQRYKGAQRSGSTYRTSRSGSVGAYWASASSFLTSEAGILCLVSGGNCRGRADIGCIVAWL
jgi:hypothetical protein